MTLNNVPGKQIIKGIVTLMCLAAVGFFISQVNWSGKFGVDWLKNHVEHNSALGMLQFSLLCAGLTAIGMPRQLLAFAAGFIFSTLLGTLLATLATLFGALITYAIARFVLAHTAAHDLFGKHRKIGQFLQTATFRKTLTIRLLPVGNNLITNIIAGISHAPVMKFSTGSFLGYLPQTFIFALAGAGTSVGSSTKMLLGIVLFVIASLLSWHLYRKTQGLDDLSPTDVTEAPQ